MTNGDQPWEDDKQRNWEYGDLRLCALRYVYGAGGGMQAVSLRGHLLLDIVVTHLLLAKGIGDICDLKRMPFSGKVKAAAKHGLIHHEIRCLLSDIGRIRNSYAHELDAQSTFRQVHALWLQALEAGVKHRFHSHEEEVEASRRVAMLGEMADHHFNPAPELADVIVELFSHIVFWNYDSFDLMHLARTLVDVER